jgi:hypothetical protein
MGTQYILQSFRNQCFILRLIKILNHESYLSAIDMEPLEKK